MRILVRQAQRTVSASQPSAGLSSAIPNRRAMARSYAVGPVATSSDGGTGSTVSVRISSLSPRSIARTRWEGIVGNRSEKSK